MGTYRINEVEQTNHDMLVKWLRCIQQGAVS